MATAPRSSWSERKDTCSNCFFLSDPYTFVYSSGPIFCAQVGIRPISSLNFRSFFAGTGQNPIYFFENASSRVAECQKLRTLKSQLLVFRRSAHSLFAALWVYLVSLANTHFAITHSQERRKAQGPPGATSSERREYNRALRANATTINDSCRDPRHESLR